MKNLDTWNIGNRYCSNIAIIGSIILIILGVTLLYSGVRNISIIFYINIGFMIASCIFSEIHLKNCLIKMVVKDKLLYGLN